MKAQSGNYSKTGKGKNGSVDKRKTRSARNTRRVHEAEDVEM